MLLSWFKNNACNVTKILKLCFKFNYLCVETTEVFFFFRPKIVSNCYWAVETLWAPEQQWAQSEHNMFLKDNSTGWVTACCQGYLSLVAIRTDLLIFFKNTF